MNVIQGGFCRAVADGPVGNSGRSESAFHRGFCLAHTVLVIPIISVRL